jgi:hypothetical protein
MIPVAVKSSEWILVILGGLFLVALFGLFVAAIVFGVWFVFFRDAYDPYRDRPPGLDHQCALPRPTAARATWACPVCHCPWVLRHDQDLVNTTEQADSRAPHETTLVTRTRLVPGRLRWHFDRDTYVEGH